MAINTRLAAIGAALVLPLAISTAVAPAASASPVPASVAIHTSTYNSNMPAVRFALAQVGKPYRWGATGPRAYDCSGLTQAAYRHAGKRIPRTAYAQMRHGHRVPRSQMRPGDLIYSTGHITMYVGHGYQVAATHSGSTVKRQRIWQRSYIVVRY